MSKFKVGDRVLCVEAGGSVNHPAVFGREYTVSKVGPVRGLITLTGMPHELSEHRFTLVTEKTRPFKAGDRVRCISVKDFASPKRSVPRIGDICTVTESLSARSKYVYLNEFSGSWSADHFELVTEAPAQLPAGITAFGTPFRPDPTSIRKGDKLTIVVEATSDGVDEDGDVQFEGFNYVKAATVIAIEPAPKPLAAGDRVTDRMTGMTGTLEAVFANHAWVRLGDRKRPNTRQLSDLTAA